ncbi:MAG: helix-turn-helix transcriptional regulator [Bacteroidota bacterium]
MTTTSISLSIHDDHTMHQHTMHQHTMHQPSGRPAAHRSSQQAPGAFADRVHQTIEARLADEAFGVHALAAAVSLSRVQLHRRVRQACGVSPGALIRERRLDRAARLLRAGQANVTEVVYAVGWNNLSHFAKLFRRHYGMLPSAYARQ